MLNSDHSSGVEKQAFHESLSYEYARLQL